MEQTASGHLVRRCAAEREPGIWEEFQARFGRLLKSAVRRALCRFGVLFDESDLEDHVQEVYCRLLGRGGLNLRRCSALAEPAIGVYLTRVAETVVIDRLRSEWAEKRGRSRQALLPRYLERHPVELAVDPAARSPEEKLLAAELRREFLARCRRAVGPRYPARDLRVLTLAFLYALSSREIARRLGGGLTPSSVDSLIHRARKRLAAEGFRIPRRKEATGSRRR